MRRFKTRGAPHSPSQCRSQLLRQSGVELHPHTGGDFEEKAHREAGNGPRSLQRAHGLSGVAAEKMVCGGKSREGCALDLGLPEGVAAEKQRRVIRDDEAWYRVGVRNPAITPPGEGGLDDGGGEVSA